MTLVMQRPSKNPTDVVRLFFFIKSFPFFPVALYKFSSSSFCKMSNSCISCEQRKMNELNIKKLIFNLRVLFDKQFDLSSSIFLNPTTRQRQILVTRTFRRIFSESDSSRGENSNKTSTMYDWKYFTTKPSTMAKVIPQYQTPSSQYFIFK